MKFKEAIKKMIERDEFAKLENHAKTKGNEEEALFISEYMKRIEEVGIDNIPMIPLLMECNSVAVLQDAIVFMQMED